MRVVRGGADVVGTILGDTIIEARDDYSGPISSIEDALSGFSSAMRERVHRTVERVQDLNIGRKAQALMRGLNNLWTEDDIIGYLNIGEFQHAKPVMRRWVMTNPNAIAEFLRDDIEGYGDDYNADDYDQKLDYARVTDGVILTKDGKTFSDTYINLDEPLNIYEQVTILGVWDVFDEMLENDDTDPTSKWNNLKG